MTHNIPRLMVAAIQGRSGKTTFTIGLLRALCEKGLLVQPFKKGPDYIDPSWATVACGVTCRNLDAVMMTNEQIKQSFCKQANKVDMAVVEGAMGVFDGLDVLGSNSSAELAKLLNIPVILVVSGQRITRSVAALINGVVHFDPELQIAGVVLNQVARQRHLNIMTQSIEKYCDVPVLGALPKASNIEIPDRHLGLIPAREQEELLDRIAQLGTLVQQNVDLDKIVQLGQAAKPITTKLEEPIKVHLEPTPRIAYFFDRAFSFYYPENLEALRDAGAELIKINSLTDKYLRDADGLYIGGGFPEMLAEEISQNTPLLNEVYQASKNGMPIYAECGGLMYLADAIEQEGSEYKMAGVFPCHVSMEKRPQGHGYSIQKSLSNNLFFKPDQEVLGHEFHHSKVKWKSKTEEPIFAYQTKRGKGILEKDAVVYDGLVSGKTFATYHHFHATSDAQWAKKFAKLAYTYHKDKNML